MALKAITAAKVVTVIAVIAYPLALHGFVVNNAGGWLGIGLALLPVVGLVGWLVKQTRHPLLAGTVIVLIGAGVWSAWRAQLIDFTAAYYFPHVLINLTLMIAFGHTLLPGREALISSFARRVHGSLPPEIAAYTVQVTWLWTLYFAATVVVSLLLYYFAPLRIWSIFANVLGIPLAILVFIGEYIFRINHIRNFPHVSIFKGMRAMMDHSGEKSETK